jgi:formyltetrahydrofolate deformylase
MARSSNRGGVRIPHKDDLEDLVEKGRDMEKLRAVRWHIENGILLYSNKTVIFE